MPKVLALSDGAVNSNLKDIVESTAAVVFLGTPHRGGGRYADLGQVARKIISVLCIATNPALLDSLGLRNADLERTQDSFSRIWQKYDFKVKTFQEELPLTGVNIPGTVLNETVCSIPRLTMCC